MSNPQKPVESMQDMLPNEYARLLRRKLGCNLKSVIWFRTWPLCDETECADYNFVIIVDKRTKDIRELVLDVDVEMMGRHEKLFAAVLYDEVEWQRAQMFPFAWNINREGIAV